jgi:nucleoid DNA-binding protein
MNKKMLMARMSKLTKFTQQDCKKSIEAFIDSVMFYLKAGKKVILTDFGVFKILKRKERIGVNPQTGKKMNIKGKRVVKFVPGKELREAVVRK